MKNNDSKKAWKTKKPGVKGKRPASVAPPEKVDEKRTQPAGEKPDVSVLHPEKISIKPSTLLAPVPAVIVSCKGKPDGQKPQANMLTIAWAGTVCSDPPMLAIAVRKERWSHEQIKESREFVINLVNKEMLWAADFCGVKSGADIDKFKACKLTPIEAEGLHLAPAIKESPLSISCRLSQILELGSHDLMIGKVVAVQADKRIMKGQKLCLGEADLIAFAHGEYYELGSILGFFGYSIASPEVLHRRLPSQKAEAASKAAGRKNSSLRDHKNSQKGKKESKKIDKKKSGSRRK